MNNLKHSYFWHLQTIAPFITMSFLGISCKQKASKAYSKSNIVKEDCACTDHAFIAPGEHFRDSLSILAENKKSIFSVELTTGEIVEYNGTDSFQVYTISGTYRKHTRSRSFLLPSKYSLVFDVFEKDTVNNRFFLVAHDRKGVPRKLYMAYINQTDYATKDDYIDIAYIR